jgi:Putative phage tail protein
MPKVVTEVAIGAAAIALAVAMPGIGAGLVWMTLGMQNAIIGSLVGIGSSMVMSGVADALRVNQGGLAVGVTTPIGPWGYVYGTQKVGGIEIFRESNSSQGTSNDKELHRVYVLACHPCALGAWQVRIDGKQVMMNASGTGYASYSPSQVGFGITSISRASGTVTMVLASPMPAGTDGTTLQVRSVADGSFNGTWTVTQPNPSDFTTFTYVCGGPDASSTGGSANTTYSDYKDKIYVEFLNGNHTATFPGLLASGTTWGPSDLCLGRTLVYIRMGYDDGVFPSSIPNVSFIIDGKNDILDPRTGLRGFTNNAVLCIADFMSLPPSKGGFGLTIGTDIPAAQLIAAANICDETVALAAGGTVKRYTCDTFVQLNSPRGTILKDMLSSCSGRLSYQGGQYSIFPGAWVAPTLQLTDGDLVGGIKTHPRFSIRDTCNAVKGTYVSPENAYQQADVPAYMQDATHGFVADPWLAEDNGERIFREANFPCTNNSATAQRLAKIALLRTRFQKRLTIQCSLKAYQAVALDVIQLSHPRYNWVNQPFEVLSSRFILEKSGGKAPRPYVELDLAETDASIYDWSATEQLTPQGYKQPNNVGVRLCNPPDGVTGYSGPGEIVNGITYPSTITTGTDGRVTNSLYIRWRAPNDANVVYGGHIEIQWQVVGDSSWTGLTKVDPTVDHVFVPNVSDGQQYNMQVRAVNCAGVPSDWVICGPVTISSVVSSLSSSGVALAPAGTLTSQGMSDGTAHITALPFTARVGTAVANCTPTPSTLTGLYQAQLYYVYYIDATFAGGNITPIATQNILDFENKTGYYLIGSIVTATYTPRYQPSHYSDVGSSSTSNPGAAYDNNTATDAIVSAALWSSPAHLGPPPAPQYYYQTSTGDCIWSGFAPVTISSSLTLHVLAGASASVVSGSWLVQIKVTIAGTTTTLVSYGAAATEADNTMTIPAGTNLSTVSVEAVATITPPSPGNSILNGSVSGLGFEIYIQ